MLMDDYTHLVVTKQQQREAESRYREAHEWDAQHDDGTPSLSMLFTQLRGYLGSSRHYATLIWKIVRRLWCRYYWHCESR